MVTGTLHIPRRAGVLLILLSWTIAVRAWSSLDAEPPMPARWLLRAFGTLSVLAGALIGLAWIAQLVPIALSGIVGPEYLDSPSAFWTIRIVDLGFIVPLKRVANLPDDCLCARQERLSRLGQTNGASQTIK